MRFAVKKTVATSDLFDGTAMRVCAVIHIYPSFTWWGGGFGLAWLVFVFVFVVPAATVFENGTSKTTYQV